MIRKLLCFSLFFAGVSLTSHAQKLPVTKGSFETAIAGHVDPDGPAGTEVALDLRFGAFVKNYNQLGIDFGWERYGDISRGGLGVFGHHLFETKTYLLPYVGFEVGYGSAEPKNGSKDSGFELGLASGLKYFLSDHVSLNTELSASVSSGDTFLGEDGTENADVKLTFGLSFLW